MYDFIVNGSNLSTLISDLTRFQGALLDNIDMIYFGIDSLEVGWSGESYQEFKKSTLNLKDPLTELSVFIGAYIQVLEDQSEQIQTLIEKVNAEFDGMV